jgi:hypothetical protein
LKIINKLESLANPTRGASGSLLVARTLALGVSLLLFVWAYFFFATQLINQTNPNRQRSDQQNNIEHTKIAQSHMRPDISDGLTSGVGRWLPHYTDGVVNPLWPWLSARLQGGEKRTDQEMFVRGKWINVIMTVVFCLVCGWVASRYFSLLTSLNLMLLLGFGVFLPQAVFYQPEPLYYMLFLLCWLCCLMIFHRNAVWTYAVLGVLCGLAYLAKTSVQPLMISFVLVTSFRWLLDVGASLFKRQWVRQCSEWVGQRHVVGMVFFGTMFLVTAGPRLSYSHERYGAAFHSYPSYWMWMDDFNEGARFMQEHQTAEELGALTKEDKPSFGKYMREHEGNVAQERLLDGFSLTVQNLLSPKEAKVKKGVQEPWRTLLPDRGGYLLLLCALLVALLVWSWIQRPKKDQAIALHASREGFTAALFVGGCTLVYALAYGWYVPIGKGDRFMMSLYAPLIVCFLWASESLVNRLTQRTGRPFAWLVLQGVQLVLLGLIVARLLQLYGFPYFYTKT